MASTVQHDQPPPAGCPVDHKKAPPPGCPVDHTQAAPPAGCPVDHSKPPENHPTTGECPAPHSRGHTAPGSEPAAEKCPVEHKGPAPAARKRVDPEILKQLPNDRETSTIPSLEGPWQYPSQRQFYKATAAKGHDVNPADMASVIAIHNAVNEQAWVKIMQYEKMHEQECATPKLIRFLGRPGDMSMKARVTGWFGRTDPFDRHDWHVDRCGKEVRYIVDFYDGKPVANMPVSIYIDARPDFQTGGLWDRARMYMRELNLF